MCSFWAWLQWLYIECYTQKGIPVSKNGQRTCISFQCFPLMYRIGNSFTVWHTHKQTPSSAFKLKFVFAY